MSIAAIIADMVRAGVDPDIIGRAAEAMATPVKGVDPAAEKRRAYDRERKRRAAEEKASTGIPPESADSTGAQPLETKGFSTPLPKTQTYNPSEPKGSSGKLPAHTRDADFDRFWQAWPTRVGKAKARQALPAAVRKLARRTPDPLGLILTGLERAKAMWRDPQFIPHPATWLNQERWDDEPTTVTPFPGPRNDRPPPRQTDRQTAFVDRLRDIDAAMAAAVEQPCG